MHISGNDVYVAGKVNGTATLWKNGIEQTLNFQEPAYSVYVSGTDVYVIGEKVTLWKNRVAQRLSTQESFATSVFVQR